jgi:lipopolysaccharide transport system ATP-binding protein
MKEDIALEVENVSKQYRLGLLGTGTISHDLNRWWYLIRGKEDPYLLIGERNDRSTKGNSEYVWALKDINFHVKKGEVLGIVGKNGAGKSTLLKLLSNVTTPSTGKITMKGRVASLLEVGTGFHPELTGKENVFLNGAILGMTRKEIAEKLQDIIEFSGCERYIDTPVKRYSSGMKVRLAFAVAAFLEPEILIVDEVLAVGDAEFQKKAIGKMKEVGSEGGRTVLFVSHNMAAVKSLCTRAILLENGCIVKDGDTDEVINKYLVGSSNIENHKKINIQKNGFTLHDIGVRANQKKFEDPILADDKIEIYFNYTNNNKNLIHINIKFKGEDGEVFMSTSSSHDESVVKEGENELSVTFPANFFNEANFYIDLLVVENRKIKIIEEFDVLSFLINPESKELGSWMGKEKGYIKGIFEWN